MDKNKKLFYTIIGAISALAAATAVYSRKQFKKENASVARKGLMHFCFVRLFCHSPIEIALDADFFVTKQLL